MASASAGPEGGSITLILHKIKSGERAAAQDLWEAYFRRVVGLARARLRGAPRGADGAESVALAALHSLIARAEAGRFPKLDDRHDLWHLLVVLTVRKAISRMRSELKRPAITFTDLGEAGVAGLLDGRDVAADVLLGLNELMGRLDQTQRRIAGMKLEGHTNAAIGAALGLAEVTIEKRLRKIRQRWADWAEELGR